MTTTLRRLLTATGLLVAGALLMALVVTEGVLALPPIALPVALLALGAGLATFPLPDHVGTPEPADGGHRPV